ncbi:hypothetical protein [Collimonas sp. OK307]|uniref:hypothetical protein n=1 Tax=Collimonas sp. OK307 TaxID=1801620 RepID=UPI000B819F99|nr:hypothetical protein [Collimonas sp. OK307]
MYSRRLSNILIPDNVRIDKHARVGVFKANPRLSSGVQCSPLKALEHDRTQATSVVRELRSFAILETPRFP